MQDLQAINTNMHFAGFQSHEIQAIALCDNPDWFDTVLLAFSWERVWYELDTVLQSDDAWEIHYEALYCKRLGAQAFIQEFFCPIQG